MEPGRNPKIALGGTIPLSIQLNVNDPMQRTIMGGRDGRRRSFFVDKTEMKSDQRGKNNFLSGGAGRRSALRRRSFGERESLSRC